jgi:uncharacterized protein YcnI
MTKRHLAAAAGLGTAAILLLAAPASAHIEPTIESAAASSYTTFSLQVPHGCGDAGTSKLEVQIPDSITSVTPEVVPGWTITRTTEHLDTPRDDGEGGQITDRTSVITWAGGPLAHDQLELFGLSVKMPDTAGRSVTFPTIQTCEDGSHTDWIEPTVEGQDEPEHPAPTIHLTAASGDDHGGGGTAAATASADDDDGDSATPLAIAGIVMGALGLVVGGAALAKSRAAR